MMQFVHFCETCTFHGQLHPVLSLISARLHNSHALSRLLDSQPDRESPKTRLSKVWPQNQQHLGIKGLLCKQNNSAAANHVERELRHLDVTDPLHQSFIDVLTWDTFHLG